MTRDEVKRDEVISRTNGLGGIRRVSSGDAHRVSHAATHPAAEGETFSGNKLDTEASTGDVTLTTVR